MTGMVQSTPSRGPSGPVKRLLVIGAILLFLAGLFILLPMLFFRVSEPPRRSPAVLCSNEISYFDIAIQNFKTTYKVDYIPSKFKLCENYSDYNLVINPATGQPVDPLAVESL